MKGDIPSFIGLMRRASCLAIGEDDTLEAVSKGKARLLLLPEDGKEKSFLRAQRSLEGHSALKIVLPFPESELAGAVGTGRCSMAAVTDLGFAEALMKQLAEQYPGRYDEQLDQIIRRSEKIRRRKTEKPGIRTKKKSAGEDK